MRLLKEGEIVRNLQDRNLFEVKKITHDFVILNALDGSSQIMAGKRGFDFIFERIPPSLPVAEFGLGRALEG